MIADLKPYPAMKDSGVPWLGEVPEHWELLPALAAFKPRQVKNTGMIETTVLSLSYGRIIVKPPEKLRGLVPESFETYQIVNPGNIIVRTTDLQNDHTSLRIGHSQHRGIITSAYMCLETTARVLNTFGYQYLNAYDLLKIIYGFGSGLRQNLDFSDIKRMPVLVPPLPEQAAIVRFLDHADRRIRRYIRAKQKLIKLLEEQKQAIIHRAVTRGLDPSVRLKPSGVEWLGDVPEHWEVLRGKYIGRLFSTPSVSDEHLTEVSDGLPMYLKVSDLGKVDAEFRLVASALYVRESSETTVNTSRSCIVFPKRGGAIYTNKVAIVEGRFLLDPNLMGWTINDRFAPRYVALLLKTRTLTDLADVSSVPQINNKHIDPIFFPAPSIQEQRTILKHLSEATTEIGTAIARTNRKIELLREYRTRLIADVVTGKLDVREGAARLPDEPEEPKPPDEVDAMIDVEEEPGDNLDPTLEETGA